MINLSVEVNVQEGGLVREGFGDFKGELSLAELLAFTKQALILTADEVLREEQAQGFDLNPIIAVDGRVGKPVIDVSPIGSIDFTTHADMGDILLETYQGILDRSPVLTGQYKSSNYVFWNGKQVATDLSSLQAWIESSPELKDSDLIRFVNIQPYARKLERLGVTAQKRSKPQRERTRTTKVKGRVRYNQPNGDYYLTARSIRAKYKTNAVIRFEFISGSQLGITGNFVPRKGKPGRAYLYPSILISVQASGVY